MQCKFVKYFLLSHGSGFFSLKEDIIMHLLLKNAKKTTLFE
jgi:hypothetical protein